MIDAHTLMKPIWAFAPYAALMSAGIIAFWVAMGHLRRISGGQAGLGMVAGLILLLGSFLASLAVGWDGFFRLIPPTAYNTVPASRGGASVIDAILGSLEQVPPYALSAAVLCLTMALFAINISTKHRRPASSSRANRSQRTQCIPWRGNFMMAPVLLVGGCVLLSVLHPWPFLPMHDLVQMALQLSAASVGVMLVTSCLTLLFRPALIGRGGERAVRQALAQLGLPALHDVVLADALGHLQIDHLVQTGQGIVVIETKAFTGWITGTLHGAQWVQHLAGGRIRHGFQNPVRQNHRHCKAIEAAIGGLAPVHGQIVFVGRARFCQALEAVALPVAGLGPIAVNNPWVACVDPGEMAAAWTRLEALARRTPKLRHLHRAEVRARRTPEQVLTARMAWALLPVGALSIAVGLAPMLTLVRG